MSHRPNDYHPDHRYTGVLVQDAAFMVTVPFFCPDTPPLENNPAFLYYSDNFQKPNPFTADVIVAIDDVFDKKIDAVDALVSQVYEGGRRAHPSSWPRSPPIRSAGAPGPARITASATQRSPKSIATRWKSGTAERGKGTKYAEAFEICEYGRRPSEGELKKLFPFFD